MAQINQLQTEPFQKDISPYKVVMLGDMAVGKSSIVYRFTKNKFELTISPTLGAAYVSKDIELDDIIVRLNIWDTSGQERYASLTQSYYRNSPAAIIVYDITNSETFQRAKSWVNQLRNNVGAKCVIALIGNKLDLKDKRQVNPEEVQQYAQDEGLLFREVSAKDDVGILQIFQELAEILPKKIKVNTEGFGIVDTRQQNKKSKCC